MNLSEQRALCLPLSDGVGSHLSTDLTLSCRRLLKMAWAEGIRVTAVAEIWNGRCHQGGDRHRGRDMVRHAGCLCGNKCTWTLKSGGTHQPASTLVNHDSPQNTVATQKTLWGMIPGLSNPLRYIQRMPGSSQVGRGQILYRDQSRDLLPHVTTFLSPGLCWKLQR